MVSFISFRNQPRSRTSTLVMTIWHLGIDPFHSNLIHFSSALRKTEILLLHRLKSFHPLTLAIISYWWCNSLTVRGRENWNICSHHHFRWQTNMFITVMLLDSFIISPSSSSASMAACLRTVSLLVFFSGCPLSCLFDSFESMSILTKHIFSTSVGSSSSVNYV